MSDIINSNNNSNNNNNNNSNNNMNINMDDDILSDDENPLLGSTTIHNEQYINLRGFPQNNNHSTYKQHHHHQKVSLKIQLSISMYWFGWSFVWLPLLISLIPSQVESFVGDENKGQGLGSVMLMGSLVSPFCAPIFGALSDKSNHRWGRRRPFMLAGSILSTIGLLLMGSAKSIHIFRFAFIITSIANNMILAPCSALLPDVVPVDQRGGASGWIGGFTMLGSLGGGAMINYIDTLGTFGTYLILISVNLVCVAITLYNVKETPLLVVGPRRPICRLITKVWQPFKSHDFRVVFFTRFVMQMGILTIQEYLEWYIRDAIGGEGQVYYFHSKIINKAQGALSFMFVWLLVGAFLSSIVSGFISDFIGRRKIILYIAAILMGFSCIILAFNHRFELAVIMGVVFGFGYGAFSVIDWAMATDVLPNQEDFAHDMGVWSLALVLPQVLAAPLAGTLRDNLEKWHPDLHLGYTAIFLLACTYFALGAYFVQKLEKVR